MNPAFVAGPTIELEPGTLNWSKGSRQLAAIATRLKNYLGLQELGSVNFITPDAEGLSYHIRMGRVPNADEMNKIVHFARSYGLTASNTADGVTLLNIAEDATAELATRMKPKIEQFVRKITPDAKLTRVRHQTVFVDSSELLAKKNEGLGKATENLWESLQELKQEYPQFYKNIMDSEDIQRKAAENLLRLRAYGGLGQRIDVEKALEGIATKRLRGFLDDAKKNGYKGLPVVGGAGAMPVVGGYGSAEDERW
jgi:hypothetical protein